MNSDSPLFPIARRYFWTVPIVAVGGFLTSLLEGIGIGLVIPLLAVLSGGGDAQATGGVVGLLHAIPSLVPEPYRLPLIAGLILLSILLKGIMQTAQGLFVAWIDGRAAHEIRERMAELLLSVGYPFFLQTGRARLLNAIGTESWKASDAIRMVFGIVGAAGTVLVFGLLLLAINWQLFLVAVAGAVVLRFVQRLASARVSAASAVMRAANEGLAARMIALTASAVKVVRLFSQEGRERNAFAAASDAVRRTMLRIYLVSTWYGPTFEFSYAALFMLILFLAHWQGIEVPVLIAFLLLLYRMQPHVQGLAGALVHLASLRASVEEVEWLMDMRGKPGPPLGTAPFPGLWAGVEFEDVDFDYAIRSGEEPALRGISFSLPAGGWTGLDGASGAGKSTIINLICRLLAPTRGRISVDGTSLGEIDPAAWRAAIGIAGQDLDLLEGTIGENIGYGAPHAGAAEIAAAARAAAIEDFIESLPQRYDTPVGDLGLAVSGGQRQRIGIARALVREPQLLILDEATNALDAATEATVLERIRAAAPACTVLVISHRASTLAHCDRIVRLERGTIAGREPAGEARQD